MYLQNCFWMRLLTVSKTLLHTTNTLSNSSLGDVIRAEHSHAWGWPLDSSEIQLNQWLNLTAVSLPSRGRWKYFSWLQLVGKVHTISPCLSVCLSVCSIYDIQHKLYCILNVQMYEQRKPINNQKPCHALWSNIVCLCNGTWHIFHMHAEQVLRTFPSWIFAGGSSKL